MADIDVPMDDLPPPPPEPWRPHLMDWDGDGLDPALDRTTQLVVDAADGAANEEPGALVAALGRGGLAAHAARIWAGAPVAWRARQEALAAPHPEAETLERIKGSIKTMRELESWDARKAAQDEQVARRRRWKKAQLRVPVCVLVFWLSLRLWIFDGGPTTWLATGTGLPLAAVLAAVSWRAGGAAMAAAKRGQPAAMAAPEDEELAAAERLPLDAATITGALQSAGFLKDGQGVTVTKVKPMHNNNGWSCWVKLPPNLPARMAMAKRHEIASYLDTVDGCVVMLQGTESNRDLWLWQADHPPLAGPPTTSPLTMAKGRVNNWRGIPLGLSIHGESIVAKLAGTPGWLIAGDPGTGKSFLARLLALGVALDPDAQGIWMDPDSSGTWEPFGQVGEYLEGASSAELRAMVERLEELAGPELERRRAALAEYRRRNPMGVAESKLTERIARDKKAGMPLLVVFLEECHVLLRSEFRDRAIAALITLATQGRKWGIVPVLLTQYATDRNLPVEIRNVLKTRICLSVATEGAARVALGDIVDSTPMDPVALRPDEMGAFYFHGAGHVAPSAPFVLGRSDLVDDNEVPDVLALALQMRRERRPELLPGAGTEEEHEGVVLTKGTEEEPTVIEHLEHLVAIFAEGEDALRSAVIVDRLKLRSAHLYARLQAGGLNRHLRTLGLATEKINREGHRGLRLRTVEHALIRERGE